MSENMDGRGDCPPQQTREEFDSKTYSENVKFVGRALVVNNDQFRGSGNNPSPERKGSMIDFRAVIALLKDLGFAESHIESHQNLTKGQLKEIIEEAAGYEYSDFGCFVCVIMSFGEPGIIICPGEEGSKMDERCEIKDIQAPFTGDKCPKLATKPKIYFIMGNSNYLEKHGKDGRDEEKPSIKLETRKIPRECNFITQFSEGTDQGNWASGNSSPYIWSVIEAFQTHVIQQKEDIDVLKLMTRINELTVKRDAGIPLVTSLLTKRYHFRPKKTPSVVQQ